MSDKCSINNDINFLDTAKEVNTHFINQSINPYLNGQVCYLEERRHYFKYLFEHSPDPVFILDCDGNFMDMNPATENITGYSISDLRGKSFKPLVPPKNLENDFQLFIRVLQGEAQSFETASIHKDGHRVGLNMALIPIFVDNNLTGVLGIAKDITNTIQILDVLHESKEQYRKLIEFLPDALFVHYDGIIAFANESAVKLIGASTLEEITGKSLYNFLHPEYIKIANERIKQIHREKKATLFTEQKYIRLDGTIIDVEAAGTAITYRGKPCIQTVVRDITYRKKAAEEINYLAHHDALTGLPNRYFFNDYLKLSLERFRHNKQTIGIMFVDLDRFKNINDTLGHSVGDAFLCQISKRLNMCVRENDFISRYGGDEFIIMMEGTSQEEISIVAQHIIDEFSRPFIVDGHEMFITASIGISLYPIDGDEADTIIRNADLAMYSAKEQGKNNYQFYTSNINETFCRKMKLENSLRRAIENSEFTLYYQPQVELNSSKIIGIEALIRWRHSELGLISPMEFIPLAEESGLIVQIGKWVLRTACLQNKAWQEAGFPPIPVAVNISNRQFKDKDFTNTITQTLKETGLDPKYLELEITESVMQNIEETPLILNKLKSIGVKLAIDDFGTGYSSLSVLQHLTIDTLKIDQAFINDVIVNPRAAGLVRTMIDMGRNLDVSIVAEGIENEIQASFLKKNNCSIGQGYFFSLPLPPSDIEKVFIQPDSN